MANTNAPPTSADLTVLLDQLSRVAPDFCTRETSYFALEDDITRHILDIDPEQPIRLGDSIGRMLKRQFRSRRLPLTIEHPVQWDIVSVRSGKFQALCSEEAIALLFVLTACLEAMEGRSA
jgi:hypothetical protein